MILLSFTTVEDYICSLVKFFFADRVVAPKEVGPADIFTLRSASDTTIPDG